VLLLILMAAAGVPPAIGQMGVGTKDWIDSPITSGNKSPPGNVTVRRG